MFYLKVTAKISCDNPNSVTRQLYCHLLERQPTVVMGCRSLLPDALRPFKIYCASPSITSQLVLFLWQTVEIGPLGHVRVEALQNFVQKCDPVTLSGIHIHIAGVQQFHCHWDTFCIKDLYPFQFYINDHLGQDVLWADQ